jgi:hypothetical protein
MRTEAEQVCPPIDARDDAPGPAGLPRCRLCSADLNATGWFGDWLLYGCAACNVIWRVTAWEVHAASKGHPTAREGR